MSSAICLKFDQSKILSSGNGLRKMYVTLSHVFATFVCGMKYWNAIPFNIGSISNITSFKRNLKSNLMTVNDFS